MNKSLSNVPDWLTEAVDACRDDLEAQSWSAAALHLLALGLWCHLSAEGDDAVDEAVAIVERATGTLQSHTPQRVTDAVRPDGWGGRRDEDSPHYTGGYMCRCELVPADELGLGVRLSRKQLRHDAALSDVREQLLSPEFHAVDETYSVLRAASDMQLGELLECLRVTPPDTKGDPNDEA